MITCLAIKTNLFRRENGIVYRKIMPVKRLLNSTTLYEVLKRGDIFAVSLDTYEFTVVKGDELVTPLDGTITLTEKNAN